MEPVDIFVVNNDICQTFLVILKKQLKTLNKTYMFRFKKVTDPSKIKNLKEKGISFPALKVRGKTIAGFDNCSKFISGQTKNQPIVPSNDDDIQEYLKQICVQKDDDSGPVGDIMDGDETKTKMRQNMNFRAQDGMKRRAHESKDELGDDFDMAMSETKMDNVNLSNMMSNDLNVGGLDRDEESDIMMQHLMNNVAH
jgi:hypothetical protein